VPGVECSEPPLEENPPVGNPARREPPDAQGLCRDEMPLAVTVPSREGLPFAGSVGEAYNGTGFFAACEVRP